MGIYDREYYRGETGGSAWFSGLAPVCKWLIGINVAVFLIEWSDIDRGFFATYMMASANSTLHHFQVWQLLTATFMHANPWHILGNMLFLWIVGREMESLYGSRDFLAFYLASAVVSTLVWAGIADLSGNPLPMVGASGAVLAVVTLYTLYYPKREIGFFFIPMPMWVVLCIYLFLPLFSQGGGAGPHTAVEAHFAGAGFALLFKHFDLRWSRLTAGRRFRPKLKIFSPSPYEPPTGRPSRSGGSSWTSTSAASTNKPASSSVVPEEQLDAQLDEVLAKIAREGRSGLTEDEQRVLQEASRRARIKRSDRP